MKNDGGGGGGGGPKFVYPEFTRIFRTFCKITPIGVEGRGGPKSTFAILPVLVYILNRFESYTVYTPSVTIFDRDFQL